MKKYTSFFKFLKETPRNLTSIILICGMAISGIIVSVNTRSDFEPFVFVGVLLFLTLIMFLSVLRVWLIYKRNS